MRDCDSLNKSHHNKCESLETRISQQFEGIERLPPPGMTRPEFWKWGKRSLEWDSVPKEGQYNCLN